MLNLEQSVRRILHTCYDLHGQAGQRVIDHQLRVGRYTAALLEALDPCGKDGIDSRDRAGLGGTSGMWLKAAGCLHDIGRSRWPTYMLDYQSSLTDEERELIMNHPRQSLELLERVCKEYSTRSPSHLGMVAVASHPLVREVCLHHQERYDGNGYPDRLIGHAIPLSSRIVAVADNWDALLTRPNGNGKPYTRLDALAALRDREKTYLDPELTERFCMRIAEAYCTKDA